MVLVDTSVWVGHLRASDHRLVKLLVAGEVACHAMVIGELACGNLQRRKEIIALLNALPAVDRVSDDEVLFFIGKHHLHGKGLGLVDVHLLASCLLAGARLWTLDKRLERSAGKLGIGLARG